MKKIILPVLIMLCLQLNLFGKIDSVNANINSTIRIMIAEAFKINSEYSEKVWSGWNKVPFAILLVTEDKEFLIGHPYPSDDFKLIGYDSLLKSNVLYRDRTFDIHLLATFPAVNGLSTVVVGTPKNTNKDPIAWIITLLHEHFHQLQNFQKDYHQSVNDLNLSGGDKTGMWMLNYPFDYQNKETNIKYDSLKKSLVKIFKNKEAKLSDSLIDNFKNLRFNFKNIPSKNDYKYFSFQIWQEGIARYTELKISKMLSDDGYKFPKTILTKSKFKSAQDFYKDLFTNQLNLLNGLKLNESHRICFYSFGAFEGLLLDKINPMWKDLYFNKKFFIENYY